MKTFKTFATRSTEINGINNYIVLSTEDRNWLTFYLIEPSGQRHCLMSRHPNKTLSHAYKDGVTLGEIYRMKPSRKSREQAILHSSRYIARVVSEFIKYELTDIQPAA